MDLNKADKNLLVRVGKCLRAQADHLEKVHGTNWALSPDARRAKKDHDRLRREERDLAALRLRLQNGSTPA